jgi:hypothetical protein
MTFGEEWGWGSSKEESFPGRERNKMILGDIWDRFDNHRD